MGGHEQLSGGLISWSPDKEEDVLRKQAKHTDDLIRLEEETRSFFLTSGDSIDMLDLSESVLSALRRSEIYTVGQLTGKTRDELLEPDDFGEQELKEVVKRLAERYLTLKG